MYSKGNIMISWDETFKSYPYTQQPITYTEISKWKEQGYYHETFAGSMYDNRNPMPEWISTIDKTFCFLKNKTYTFYRMKTLEIMPNHCDHFVRYSEIFKIDNSKVFRILLFLEDWKPGHYFELNYKAIVNWKAGDFYVWGTTEEHAASNIGIEPRYTLQITGHV